MSDRPIIFSAPMVRALLAGTKTQTRRIITKKAALDALSVFGPSFLLLPGNGDLIRFAVGDRLWVRENAEFQGLYTDGARIIYDASRYRGGSEAIGLVAVPPSARVPVRPGKLRPSIHMPRWASRLTLIVDDVRIARLQDISEEDALAEGVPTIHEGNIGDEIFCSTCQGNGVCSALGTGYGVTEVDCADCLTAKQKFTNLWVNINGPDAWDANPWVVAITFRMVRANIDASDRDGMEGDHAP